MGLDWKRTAEVKPREGRTVLGYNRDLDKVGLYVYRVGTFHAQDEEHFHGWDITWWALVDHPPLGQPRRVRKARKRALRVREMGRRRRDRLVPQEERP